LSSYGVAQLDVGILQLDEHQRQAVDVKQHIRAAEAALALDPELGDAASIPSSDTKLGIGKPVFGVVWEFSACRHAKLDQLFEQVSGHESRHLLPLGGN
jgi:hypothetical protein